MEYTINGNSRQALPLSLEAVHILAEELPLNVILLELHRFYQDSGDEPPTQTNPACQQICDTWLGSLDAALWRLETNDLVKEGGG